MIEIGTVVQATVARNVPFGIYLQSETDTVFVPLNNISWTPTPDLLAQFEVGQSHRVLIERFNYEKSLYVGSMRLLTPEQNPYREFSNLQPDTVIRGRVKMLHANGVTVELNKWCSGEVPLSDESRNLSVGAEVDVQITSLEINTKSMTLKLTKSKI